MAIYSKKNTASLIVMKIMFVTTGGTIDKDYASRAGTYNFEISEPAVRRIMESIKPGFEFEVQPILQKDSLDMTEEDRMLIYERCEKADANRIIITHGTDTMVETAKRLSALKDKTIVLVGSSKPERFRDSDAHFNIGVAVGAVGILPEGVYIAMNGKVFPWHNVRKNRDSGAFEAAP